MKQFDFIQRTESAPPNADFCLRLQGDDMLPYFRAGETVYIQKRIAPKELQPGLFYYKGEVFCRQWCIDYLGRLLLLPANSDKGSDIVAIPAESVGDCLCLGSVITDEVLPMPAYR